MVYQVNQPHMYAQLSFKAPYVSYSYQMQYEMYQEMLFVGWYTCECVSCLWFLEKFFTEMWYKLILYLHIAD